MKIDKRLVEWAAESSVCLKTKEVRDDKERKRYIVWYAVHVYVFSAWHYTDIPETMAFCIGVSKYHFPMYLKEMEHRFNHRNDNLFKLFIGIYFGYVSH